MKHVKSFSDTLKISNSQRLYKYLGETNLLNRLRFCTIVS